MQNLAADAVFAGPHQCIMLLTIHAPRVHANCSVAASLIILVILFHDGRQNIRVQIPYDPSTEMGTLKMKARNHIQMGLVTCPETRR